MRFLVLAMLVLSTAAPAHARHFDLNDGLQVVTPVPGEEPGPETHYGQIKARFDGALSPSSIDVLRSRWSGRCFPRAAEYTVGAILAVETRTENNAGPIFSIPETKIMIVTYDDREPELVDDLPSGDHDQLEQFISRLWETTTVFSHDADYIRGDTSYAGRQTSYHFRADEKYIYSRILHKLDYGASEVAYCYFFKKVK